MDQPAITFLDEQSATRKLRRVAVGTDVIIRDFVNAYECHIGSHSRVGTFVEIQNGVKIGQRCKISSHSFLCEGVFIEDEVFIGHNVVFVNDRYPRATSPSGQLQTAADWKLETVHVGKRASIGSGSVILCGVTIGEGALVGAGSVVTKNVPAHSVVAGNPARVLRPPKDIGGNV